MSTARFSGDELLATSEGRALASIDLAAPVSLSTDTRTLSPGDWFVPLEGERFNGHDHLARAFENGASGAFVSEAQASQHPQWSWPNLVVVGDTLQAYLRLARLHRQRLNPTVIAITGSSGKTTVKEMMAAALSPLAPTQKSQKNFNNEVGLSQTLLGLMPETRYLVVEMGMRGPGQIALLTEHAQPDVGVITSLGPAHIEFFEDGLAGIARAKCEIFSAMSADTALGVIAGDNPLLLETAQRAWPGKLLLAKLADASAIAISPDETRFVYQGCPITIPLPGQHQVVNALCVLLAGQALGFSLPDLARGLARLELADGRWQRRPIAGYADAWVINDAYNANPASMRAALSAFLASAKPATQNVLVLGGMKELGPASGHYHEELGRWLAEQSGVSLLIAVGEGGAQMAQGARSAAFAVETVPDTTQALARLRQFYPSLSGITVLLKGSRAYGLEAIAEALTAEASAQPTPEFLAP